MLYECEVTFLDKKPFKFFNISDVNTVEENKKYDLLLSSGKDQLIIHSDFNYHLCSLQTSNYQYRVSNDRTYIVYRPRDKRNDQSKDIDVLQIVTDSKQLIKFLKEVVVDINKKSQKKVHTVSTSLSYTPSKQHNISLLSSQSHEQRFRGFLNLGVIILVVMNIRGIISNFYQYGNQLARGEISFFNGNGTPSLLMFAVYILCQYWIERLFFTNKIKPKLVNYTIKQRLILTCINLVTALVFHVFLCQRLNTLPMPALLITSYLFINVLKLISYYQVNSEIYFIADKIKRTSTNENYRNMFAEHEIDTPNLELIASHKNNIVDLLTFRHFLYFLAAPTLCYQLQYPRNSRIRYVWLLKRCVEFVVIGALEIILWVQYYQPALDKVVTMVQTNNYTYLNLLEELLEISIPTILMWIGGFYLFFQVWLNILGEILRFADRHFYDDWWNCKNLMEYWQMWNLPVHYWFIRHLYNPLLKKGYSKSAANLTVFLISAVAHEYLVSVPLGVISFYAFLAMILQSPIIYLEKKLNKALKIDTSQLGNVSFWISYCILGQPICVSIYYYLYVTKGTR